MDSTFLDDIINDISAYKNVLNGNTKDKLTDEELLEKQKRLLEIENKKKSAVKKYNKYKTNRSILCWMHIMICLGFTIWFSIIDQGMLSICITIAIVTIIDYIVFKIFKSRYTYFNKYIMFDDYVFLDEVLLKKDVTQNSEIIMSKKYNIDVIDTSIVSKRLFLEKLNKSIILNKSQYRHLNDLLADPNNRILIHKDQFKRLLECENIIEDDKLTFSDIFN